MTRIRTLGLAVESQLTGTIQGARAHTILPRTQALRYKAHGERASAKLYFRTEETLRPSKGGFRRLLRPCKRAFYSSHAKCSRCPGLI